jgi:hypothetical protein
MTTIMTGKDGVDPLTRGPAAAQELFKRYSKVSNDFDRDAVIGAAANIVLNAVRQSLSKRQDADAAIIRLLETLRSTLNEHYDGLGQRRSVFPFHQVVEMPLIKFPKNRF